LRGKDKTKTDNDVIGLMVKNDSKLKEFKERELDNGTKWRQRSRPTTLQFTPEVSKRLLPLLHSCKPHSQLQTPFLYTRACSRLEHGASQKIFLPVSVTVWKSKTSNFLKLLQFRISW